MKLSHPAESTLFFFRGCTTPQPCVLQATSAEGQSPPARYGFLHFRYLLTSTIPTCQLKRNTGMKEHNSSRKNKNEQNPNKTKPTKPNKTTKTYNSTVNTTNQQLQRSQMCKKPTGKIKPSDFTSENSTGRFVVSRCCCTYRPHLSEGDVCKERETCRLSGCAGGRWGWDRQESGSSTSTIAS